MGHLIKFNQLMEEAREKREKNQILIGDIRVCLEELYDKLEAIEYAHNQVGTDVEMKGNEVVFSYMGSELRVKIVERKQVLYLEIEKRTISFEEHKAVVNEEVLDTLRVDKIDDELVYFTDNFGHKGWEVILMVVEHLVAMLIELDAY